jgi:hypothetical protein
LVIKVIPVSKGKQVFRVAQVPRGTLVHKEIQVFKEQLAFVVLTARLVSREPQAWVPRETLVSREAPASKGKRALKVIRVFKDSPVFRVSRGYRVIQVLKDRRGYRDKLVSKARQV